MSLKCVVPEFHMGKFSIADIGGMQRLVDCANALSKINEPQNHVDTTEDYVKRLEGLRRDAWARVQELEAQSASQAPVA